MLKRNIQQDLQQKSIMENNIVPTAALPLLENDKRYLHFLDLKNNDSQAILLLKEKISPVVKNMSFNRGISQEDYEELLHDAILICLRKIQNGSCQYRNCSPATYTIAVARRLLANHCRKQSFHLESLDGHQFAGKMDPCRSLLQKESQSLLQKALSKLGDTGAQLIRLHYLEGYRDKETIRLKLTPYTSVNSLKTKRNGYLKKLSTLIRSDGLDGWAVEL
jgi:RNA polymerase sigma factor (sigma-70 family)